MTDINFLRGSFHSFRATTKIHLGSIEKDIVKDDIVEFDGYVLKMGLEEHSLPALKSGIKLGWLVLDHDTTSVYTPKSSGVKVRPAQTDQEGGGPIDFKVQPVITDDEKVVSTLKSANLGQRDGKATTQESKTVGKIKTAAKQKTVITDSSAVDREISKLSENPPPKAHLLPRAGDEIQEIVVGAVTPGPNTPKPKRKSVSKIVDVGGVQWDKGVQWRRRAKLAVEKYGNNTEVLEAIKNIEAASVIKLINKMQGV